MTHSLLPPVLLGYTPQRRRVRRTKRACLDDSLRWAFKVVVRQAIEGKVDEAGSLFGRQLLRAHQHVLVDSPPAIIEVRGVSQRYHLLDTSPPLVSAISTSGTSTLRESVRKFRGRLALNRSTQRSDRTLLLGNRSPAFFAVAGSADEPCGSGPLVNRWTGPCLSGSTGGGGGWCSRWVRAAMGSVGRRSRPGRSWRSRTPRALPFPTSDPSGGISGPVFGSRTDDYVKQRCGGDQAPSREHFDREWLEPINLEGNANCQSLDGFYVDVVGCHRGPFEGLNIANPQRGLVCQWGGSIRATSSPRAAGVGVQ